MHIRRNIAVVAAMVVLCGTFVACSKKPNEEEQKKAQIDQQFTTIQQTYDQLQQTRSDLSQAEQRKQELEGIPERRRTDEQKQELDQVTARIQELTSTRDTAFDELQSNLADFLNVALNDFPDDPQTVDALRIYSEEAIVYADDAVQGAGDYKKALGRLTTAMGYYHAINAEPYPPLQQKIQELEELRYITKERFDQIKNGMTKDQVKEIAGVPYYGNIREEKAKGIEMWLYPKEDGGAAGIYFKMKTGKVYGKNFDAVKPQVAQ